MTITVKNLPNKTCVRPGIIRKATKLIVIHWTAGPGQPAEMVWNYFGIECVNTNNSASAHYAVDGKSIIELVPHNEVAWHCGAAEYWHYTPFAKLLMKQYKVDSPNYISIGIEVCIDDLVGKFNDATISNLEYLYKYLMTLYGSDIDIDWGVVRHWDITNKDCPKFYIGRNEYWKNLLIKLKG